ncbi:C1 family peptidase [Sinomicrobium weinanense]|uniref:Peptidase C1A papain C-terminal domain-containing protein n=1 Tax=Sinomicrobium weinanense TaxID=2842200 RepID=A0A926JNV5_9FLAO|nr:C1 family peptidase [Sinomicrobium weinanense]MBC9794743.1 hypothetical protein [Sinomicrobium weinanense]MBU3125002.1 hypothetical protein [Sinomicrobium weinanense]
MKTLRFTSVLAGLLLVIAGCIDPPTETPPDVDISRLRVDLRPQQTPIRNQGGRTSCQTFAAVAALEASFKRLGYGDKDLSEEFVNYMRKNFWLHPEWDEIALGGPNKIENQIGAFGGGGGAHSVAYFFDQGMKVPLETDMAYRPLESDYAASTNFFPYGDPRNKIQWYANSFNLDTVNLTRQVLHNENFHGAGSGRFYPDPADARNVTAIESILRRGLEVVWDFAGNVKYGDIWRPCETGDSGCSGNIAHSMLIVGFDKTDSDPDNHYFMVKNSWGPTFRTSDDQGFTYISYDFVRRYGLAMAYITVPLFNTGPWEDVQPLGRWQLVFDGHEAILDMYHIPGYWPTDWLGVPDRRIGSLFMNDKAYRVNGSFDGNKITFYFSGSEPNLRWDKLKGRKFEYYYSDSDFMAGFHTDPDGRIYGGYARKAGALSGGTQTPRPFLPKSFENSTWDVVIGERKGTIVLGDLATYEGEFPEHYDIFGTYTESGTGTTGRVQFRIPQNNYNHCFMQLEAGDIVISLEGKSLNHKPGNIAGHTIETKEDPAPFVMIRKGENLNNGG